MSKRIFAYDMLRALAALAVMAIHITAGYALLNPVAFILNQASRNAVPLFVIISGFLLAYGEQRHPLTVNNFYRRRFGRVLIPYIVWTIIYALLIELYQHNSGGNLLLWLSGLGNHLLHGTAFFHLYFLIIVFQLYLLYPLLSHWLKHYPFKLLLCSLMVSCVAIILIYASDTGGITLPSLQWYYSALFPEWLFYFVIGMWLAGYREKLNSMIRSRSKTVTFIYLASLIILLVEGYQGEAYFSSLRPGVFIYSLCSYPFLLLLAIYLEPILGKSKYWIAWLAEQSFFIFLLHPLVLTVLMELTWVPGWANIWQGVPGMLALFAATAAITWLLIWIVSLTPLVSYLGGVPRQRHN